MARVKRKVGRMPLRPDWLVRRYVQEGASIRAICSESGWAYGTVHRALLDAGVVLRRPGGDRRPRVDDPPE